MIDSPLCHHQTSGLCAPCQAEAVRRDDRLIAEGLKRLEQRNNALRRKVRRYVLSGKHRVPEKGKVRFILNDESYYLYPLDIKTQGVEVDEFRRLLSR